MIRITFDPSPSGMEKLILQAIKETVEKEIRGQVSGMHCKKHPSHHSKIRVSIGSGKTWSCAVTACCEEFCESLMKSIQNR